VNKGDLSVKCPRPRRSCGVAAASKGQKTAQLGDQGQRPTNKGEPMQTQYFIFAGAIAICGIVYLLLKLESDQIDKEIQEVDRYEAQQKKIKKALNK
jgi:hypothetical protein